MNLILQKKKKEKWRWLRDFKKYTDTADKRRSTVLQFKINYDVHIYTLEESVSSAVNT